MQQAIHLQETARGWYRPQVHLRAVCRHHEEVGGQYPGRGSQAGEESYGSSRIASAQAEIVEASGLQVDSGFFHPRIVRRAEHLRACIIYECCIYVLRTGKNKLKKTRVF